MVQKKVNNGTISIPFWVYVIAVVLAFAFALFKINQTWGFIASMIIGIILSIINIWKGKEIKWLIVKYLSVLFSLNALNLSLNLFGISSLTFTIFYIYVIIFTSILILIMGMYSLLEDK